MKLIGITGGTGMGKSTAQSLLDERGIRTVDTDQLARDLVQPGQPALAEIQAQFGNGVIDASGALRRQALARIVFADPQARIRLEGILHPRIRQRWMAETEGWKRSGAELGVVVIPLLFETSAASCFDVTVCVACSAPTQHARLKDRGWDEAEIRQRLAAQWPIERKMEAADHVVWTEGKLQVHSQQWDQLLQAGVSR